MSERGNLIVMTLHIVRKPAALVCILALLAIRAEGGTGLVEGVQDASKTAKPARKLVVVPDDPAGELALAVRQFASVLERHPARRVPKEGDRLRLYMMDLENGRTTLVADEAEPGFNWCGTPKWSHGGTRIVFATWPMPGFESGRMKAIDVDEGKPVCVDLGTGNSPTFSPRDDRIAFALEPGTVPRAEAGIWVMRADGSDRSRVGEYLGAPFWSPDGREFLTCDYTDQCVVFNFDKREAEKLAVAGQRIFSWPSWAGPATLVSALAHGPEGDSIVLLDVKKPSRARIIEVLWKRSAALDATPRWPVHRPNTRRYYFIGVKGTKRTIYWVERGQPGRTNRLEPRGYDDKLGGLSFSPDGRYLLFCGNRPEGPPE